MNICVFCSANDLEEKYTAPARELARLIGERGHTLIWGGSNVGLMKVMADTAQEHGGKIIGISLEYYRQNSRPNADEMIFAETLGERKALFIERSDVIVTLPGGLGTLDEAVEILELKKQKKHTRPSIILNIDGFYDGLQMQLERIVADKMLSAREQDEANQTPLSEIMSFCDTPEAVMARIAEVTHSAADAASLPA